MEPCHSHCPASATGSPVPEELLEWEEYAVLFVPSVMLNLLNLEADETYLVGEGEKVLEWGRGVTAKQQREGA